MPVHLLHPIRKVAIEVLAGPLSYWILYTQPRERVFVSVPVPRSAARRMYIACGSPPSLLDAVVAMRQFSWCGRLGSAR